MSPTNLRNTKLEHAKNAKYEIDVFLTNGIRLSGRVLAFDDESILITSAKADLEEGILIERHATSTIQKSVKRDNERNR
jgi:RNA chaperone Hfq